MKDQVANSGFAKANALIREGSYGEAVEILKKLVEDEPAFAPYQLTLNSALNRLRSKNTISGKNFHEVKSKRFIETERRADVQNFYIATPVRNGEVFIDETIESVLSQSGSFVIHYFIKDACSTDGTIDRCKRWAERILTSEFEERNLGVRFCYESSRDGGLYDAVSFAFKHLGKSGRPGDIQAYINADDYFLPDSFETVRKVIERTSAEWVCGQINVVGVDGRELARPKFPLAYSREDIRDGFHDGRRLYFVQQEGNFWTTKLYEKSGGLDTSLKLAGDFDLWRRFSQHTELLALDRPTAAFRKHDGQLSSQVEKYYAELATTMPKLGAVLNADAVGTLESVKASYGFMNPYDSPTLDKRQRAGPICFLDDENNVQEVVYLKRGWFTW